MTESQSISKQRIELEKEIKELRAKRWEIIRKVNKYDYLTEREKHLEYWNQLNELTRMIDKATWRHYQLIEYGFIDPNKKIKRMFQIP